MLRATLCEKGGFFYARIPWFVMQAAALYTDRRNSIGCRALGMRMKEILKIKGAFR